MPTKKETILGLSAETKGFATAQQKATKLNEAIAKGTAEQTKGFAAAQKQSEILDKALGRLTKTFSGTSGEIKKQVQTVMKEMSTLGKVDFKGAKKELGDLQDHLSGLQQEQVAVTKVMADMADKTSEPYQKLKDHLKGISGEARTTSRRIEHLTRAFSAQFEEAKRAAEQAEKARGAFVQGLAQGGLPFPAPFLQRGPGMGRQVAGMAIGKGIMGGARGAQAMGGAMFGGVGGLAQAMQALPGGGVLSGQFMTAAQYAQQNIQWQRTKLGMAPYMEDVGQMQERGDYLTQRSARLKSARSKKEKADVELEQAQDQLRTLGIAAQHMYRQKREKEARAEILSPEGEKVFQKGKGIADKAKDALIAYGDTVDATLELVKKGDLWGAVTGKGGDIAAKKEIERRELLTTSKGEMKSIEELDKKRDEVYDKMDKRRKKSLKADADYRKELSKASKKYGAGPFRDVGALGVGLMGVGKPEAAQFVGGMIQAGGGFAGEAREQGMLGTSMAAKTLFGAGPEVSGAFLQAGRRGGMVGGGGRAGGAYTDAIAEGLRMGFEGSEMTNYLQQMAQGIQSFQATGIPINPKSITTLAGDITKSGITGTRAMAMAQGLTGGLQQIGQRGIRSGLDHIMLQLVGGYQGGGAKEYRAARARMQDLAGTVQGGGVEDVAAQSTIMGALRQLMKFAGGDESAQAEMLQRAMEQLGVRGGVREFDWLQRQLAGEEFTPEQMAAVGREYSTTPGKEGRRVKGAGRVRALTGEGGRLDLEKAARTAVGTYAPGARAQAAIENRQIAVGRRMVGVVNQLEGMAVSATDAFTELTGKPLQMAIKGLGALGKSALDIARNFGGDDEGTTES